MANRAKDQEREKERIHPSIHRRKEQDEKALGFVGALYYYGTVVCSNPCCLAALLPCCLAALLPCRQGCRPGSLLPAHVCCCCSSCCPPPAVYTTNLSHVWFARDLRVDDFNHPDEREEAFSDETNLIAFYILDGASQQTLRVPNRKCIDLGTDCAHCSLRGVRTQRPYGNTVSLLVWLLRGRRGRSERPGTRRDKEDTKVADSQSCNTDTSMIHGASLPYDNISRDSQKIILGPPRIPSIYVAASDVPGAGSWHYPRPHQYENRYPVGATRRFDEIGVSKEARVSIPP